MWQNIWSMSTKNAIMPWRKVSTVIINMYFKVRSKRGRVCQTVWSFSRVAAGYPFYLALLLVFLDHQTGHTNGIGDGHSTIDHRLHGPCPSAKV